MKNEKSVSNSQKATLMEFGGIIAVDYLTNTQKVPLLLRKNENKLSEFMVNHVEKIEL